MIFSTWALFALHFAAEAKFSHPILWPFLSVIGITKGVASVVINLVNPKTYREIAEVFVSIYRAVAKGLSWKKAALIAPATLLLTTAAYYYPLITAGSLLAAFYIYTIAAALIWSVKFANRFVRDVAAWRKWCHHPPPSSTAYEFADRLLSFNLRRFRMKYLYLIRTRDMLEPTEESEKLVGFLALMTEKGEFDKDALAANIPDFAPQLRDARAAARLEAQFKRLHNPDTIDELYRLVEQLQHRRAA